MNVLVTGGIGYIGSHTIVELLNCNYNIIAIDNLVNSNIKIKDSIEKITGKKIKFYNIDLLNKDKIDEIFSKEKINAVIHFAALKSISESVEKPLEYYENNLIGTLNLLDVMKQYEIKKIIFSSSASVYGNSEVMPVKENMPLSPSTNPYGKTKNIIEEVLMDLHKSDNSWDVIILRYFNPVGAHKSGLIGELPNGMPNNLIPYVSKVANKELDHVNVFGNDYNTPDGTGVRDYIHIVDLAKGHVAAINMLLDNHSGLKVYNLGTGKGYSVLEIISVFSKVSGKEIPYEICPRRKGDVGICYADVTKAKKELNWEAEMGIEEMCRDYWNWQCKGIKIYEK